MDIIYTEINLIRYYYCETDLFETLEIEHAFEEDVDLRFEYNVMRQTLDQLKTKTYGPSQGTINNILSLSKTV